MNKRNTDNDKARGHVITLLGGAGLMGKGIVRDLMSNTTDCNIAQVRVCDLSLSQTEAVVSESGDARLSANQVDVSEVQQTSKALEGADLCINAVPTLAGFQMQIFETCLAEGCHYMDLGGLGVFTKKQLQWRQKFIDAGLVAVISTGADPGMSNMLCRAVADEFESLEKINLYWAAELVGDENPVLVPPYSISTVLAEYGHPSTQFLNGEHVECAPMTGVEVIDLPEPWGRTEFMYSPHSEPLTVPLADGFADKGIREFTWKLHLPNREHEAWVGLIKAGFADFDEPVEINGQAIKPIDFLSTVINRNIKKNETSIPQQDSHEIHFAVGEGVIDGKRHRVRCQVAVHPDELFAPYVDAATSMNASLSAQLLLTSPLKPGVWGPEEYFDSVKYFSEVRKRRMLVTSERTELD